jgi:hypothetical protein
MKQTSSYYYSCWMDFFFFFFFFFFLLDGFFFLFFLDCSVYYSFAHLARKEKSKGLGSRSDPSAVSPGKADDENCVVC